MDARSVRVAVQREGEGSQLPPAFLARRFDMRNAIFTLLATCALAGTVCAAKPDQAPRVPQAPPAVEEIVKAKVCRCSETGVCECTPGDDCGCLARGEYRWEATTNGNQTALYKGTKQLGNYWHAEAIYKALVETSDGDRWLVATCPVKPPAMPAKVLPARTIQYAVPAQQMSFSGGSGGACRS